MGSKFNSKKQPNKKTGKLYGKKFHQRGYMSDNEAHEKMFITRQQ